MTAVFTEPATEVARDVFISVGSATLSGELIIPAKPEGIVLFAHGSGSSRHSPRNQFVARLIREAGVGTLLFDLLTPHRLTFIPLTCALTSHFWRGV